MTKEEHTQTARALADCAKQIAGDPQDDTAAEIARAYAKDAAHHGLAALDGQSWSDTWAEARADLKQHEWSPAAVTAWCHLGLRRAAWNEGYHEGYRLGVQHGLGFDAEGNPLIPTND